MNKQEQQFIEKAARMDFDPQGQAQRRVWARIVRPAPVLRWRPVLGLAASLVFVLAAGMLIMQRLPGAAVGVQEQELSEEDCAKLNGRYLLARALAQSEEDCTCKDSLTAYDKQTVEKLREQLAEVACTVCSAKEQRQLHQCQQKYPSQLKEFKLCNTLC